MPDGEWRAGMRRCQAVERECGPTLRVLWNAYERTDPALEARARSLERDLTDEALFARALTIGLRAIIERAESEARD